MLQSHQPSLHPVLLIEHKLEIVIEWIHDMKSQTTNEWIHGMKPRLPELHVCAVKNHLQPLHCYYELLQLARSQELYLEMGCCFFYVLQ
jgi:hypothetical protein